MLTQGEQEQLFEEQFLKESESAHNAMHDIADDLFKTYQQGDIEKARDGLKDLTVAVDHLNNILGQCEQ